MKRPKAWVLLLGLGLALPAFAAVEGPLLLADARTAAPVVAPIPELGLFERVPLQARAEPRRSPLVGATLWLTLNQDHPEPSPVLLPVFSRERLDSVVEPRSRILQLKPLPRQMRRNWFPHGRVRGPFEQVFPRVW